jgi:hypothetical protein
METLLERSMFSEREANKSVNKDAKVRKFCHLLIGVAYNTFLGLKNIKRFFPASILIVLLEGVNVQVGKRRRKSV